MSEETEAPVVRHGVEMGELVTMKLEDLIPYWRNPRRVTDESVNLLAESIRKYGYQQPIVVDADNVIIVGHTRYIALRRLDVTEVPVLIARTLTPEQVKQFRVIDNRVAEYTSWDFEKLMAELGAMDVSAALPYFPDVLGDVADTVGEQTRFLEEKWSKVDNVVEFVCPDCFHSWEMVVTREALMTGVLKVEEA